MNRLGKKTILLFDFDSTFVTVEGLDELATIVLADAPDRLARCQAIADITAQGMSGELGFEESLALRFEQIAPSKKHVQQLVELLRASISPSFLEHKDYLRKNAENIWVVSGGFKDFIVPVVATLGIAANHVLANEFIWSDDGKTVIDYNRDNPLARNGGKIKVIKTLGLPKDTHKIMIGDGMTDYAVRGVGLVDEFVAFTETVAREPVIEVADRCAESFSFLPQS